MTAAGARLKTNVRQYNVKSMEYKKVPLRVVKRLICKKLHVPQHIQIANLSARLRSVLLVKPRKLLYGEMLKMELPTAMPVVFVSKSIVSAAQYAHIFHVRTRNLETHVVSAVQHFSITIGCDVIIIQQWFYCH